MTETPGFRRRQGRALFTLLHEPDIATGGHAFVFCNPLVEEKLWAHRTFVAFARLLATQGHIVLRFDYFGSGDSDGEFSDASVESAIDDTLFMVDEVRERFGVSHVSLLGLRFGATIACMVAERAATINKLILWAPVIDGAAYMQELLRANVATQTTVFREVRQDRSELVEAMRRGLTVNIDGYEMSLPFFEQASAVQLASMPKRHLGDCLIVNIDKQPGRQNPALEALRASYAHAHLAFAAEEPFWREIAKSYLRGAPVLSIVTSEWLQSMMPGVGDRA